MGKKLSDLLTIVQERHPGLFHAENPQDKVVEFITDDSRRIAPGAAFVARSGTHADGAAFLRQAVAGGATAVVFDPTHAPAGFDVQARQAGAVPVFSSKPEVLLGYLAQAMAGNPADKLQMLAVTGTNGKTTTTFLMRSMLRAAGRRCGLIGTVETDDCRTIVESAMTTPGPLELAGILASVVRNGGTAAVMEASSHALSQDRLAGLRFNVAMFSNLTGDHLDYHITMENYAAAKARLFSDLDPGSWAVVNADDPWSERMLRDCKARVLTYGLDREAQFKGTIRRMSGGGMDLEIRGPDAANHVIHSSMVGRHNAQNLLCTIAGAWAAGLTWDQILPGLDGMDAVPGRLQPVHPPGIPPEEMPFHVLVDYAHTHDALKNVLTALRPWTRGRIILVFGCGGDRDTTKRPKMADVAQRLADDIIVTHDNPRTEDPQSILDMILAGFSAANLPGISVIPDREKAIETAIDAAGEGDIVLIAGKGHENYQIIGKVRHPFDDVKVAAAALHRRLTAGRTKTVGNMGKGG